MPLQKFLLSILLFFFSIFIPFWLIIPFLIYKLNIFLHLPIYANIFTKILGIIFIFLGAIGSIHTFFLFRKFGQGTPAPALPTKKLVIKGLYKYTRNPMYLSYFLVILGEFLVYGSILLLAYLFIFFLLINYYVINFEEPDLNKKFGKEYLDYQRKVPRWF